jgi:hypothetical protein
MNWYEPREWSEVGRLVQSTGGQWMVRPPQRCGNGHRAFLVVSALRAEWWPVPPYRKVATSRQRNEVQ